MQQEETGKNGLLGAVRNVLSKFGMAEAADGGYEISLSFSSQEGRVPAVHARVFRLVAEKACASRESYRTKATIGLSSPKIGGYLAYTPWDTLRLALVGGGVDAAVFS